ncbi:MAG TPA: hypothetical protein VH438_06240 [Gemmatimonadales bacterium]
MLPARRPPAPGVGLLLARVWDYLRFHLLHDYADVLPRGFAEAAAGMRGDRHTRDQQAC